MGHRGDTDHGIYSTVSWLVPIGEGGVYQNGSGGQYHPTRITQLVAEGGDAQRLRTGPVNQSFSRIRLGAPAAAASPVETVSHAPDTDQISRRRGLTLNLPSQCHDVVVDHAVGGKGCLVPTPRRASFSRLRTRPRFRMNAESSLNSVALVSTTAPSRRNSHRAASTSRLPTAPVGRHEALPPFTPSLDGA